MAAGTKIVIEFLNSYGNTIKHSYNYGNSEALASDVKNYGNVCIANATMFRNQPVSLKAAKAIVTSETEFDLS